MKTRSEFLEYKYTNLYKNKSSMHLLIIVILFNYDYNYNNFKIHNIKQILIF